MKQKRTLLAGAAFLVYGLLMLYLLFGQRMGQIPAGTYWQHIRSNINLRPLETMRRFWWVLRNSTDSVALRHAVVNLAGNVVMFVPLGFLAPCIWVKLRKFGWHFLYMVLIIVSVEVLQLITLLGSCDVDDLILNLVGTTIGFVIWKIGTAFQVKSKNRR